jgi:type II secretory pathway component GspD/PulD (secretin)
MKVSALIAKILILLIFLSMANTGQLYSYQERVIICMVPLEHADAEKLADTLAPFLSSQGKISAYSPTNTLIIKDQPSVVRMLLKVIKGRSDLSECQNFEHVPEENNKIP